MSKYTPATFQPVIRPDWAGVLTYLSDKEKSEILVALFKYPSIECNSAFWKETIKPDLDLQYSEFIRICAEKSRGVRNRWEKTSTTDVIDKDKISIRDVIDKDKTSIRDVIDPERECECENKNNNINKNNNNINSGNINGGNTSLINTTRTSKKFIPPELDEVLNYAKQQNDLAGVGGFACTPKIAEEFWSYYTANGWISANGSRTPIQDWKAKLRQWVIAQSRMEKQSAPEKRIESALERQNREARERFEQYKKQLEEQAEKEEAQ